MYFRVENWTAMQLEGLKVDFTRTILLCHYAICPLIQSTRRWPFLSLPSNHSGREFLLTLMSWRRLYPHRPSFFPPFTGRDHFLCALLFKLSRDWSNIICFPLVSPVSQSNFLSIYYVLYIWFVLFSCCQFFCAENYISFYLI